MTYPLKFRQHVLAFKKKEALTYAETADRSDASQYERSQRMGVSTRGICDALKRVGFSYKKTFYHPKADVQARKDFQTKLQGYEACDTAISYVDEKAVLLMICHVFMVIQ